VEPGEKKGERKKAMRPYRFKSSFFQTRKRGMQPKTPFFRRKEHPVLGTGGTVLHHQKKKKKGMGV